MSEILKESIDVIHGRVEYGVNEAKLYSAWEGFINHDGDMIIRNKTSDKVFEFDLGGTSNNQDGHKTLLPNHEISVIKKAWRSPTESEFAHLQNFTIREITQNEEEQVKKESDAITQSQWGNIWIIIVALIVIIISAFALFKIFAGRLI